MGEPINPEAWIWYHKHIGGDRCPIVDTWWQTETGAIMISPLPGATTTKPGSATFPLPGHRRRAGRRRRAAGSTEGGGYLTLTRPWPSMLRGIYGDPERYQETYWSRFEGRYFAGDGAKLDDDGYLWLLGRVDDVMNVSGHRISTTEVESALVDHPKVAEAAVVGAKDDTTGQAIIAFVTVKGGTEMTDELGEELREHVATKIGAIARPKTIIFTDDLPKTRSGKIMRRLLPRRGRGPRPGRHHHAGRPDRGRGDPPALGRHAYRRLTADAGKAAAPCGPNPPELVVAGAPTEPGPAVVFDMDGVLSDASGRQHLLERPWRDWEAFFDACGDDPLIDEVGRLLEVLDDDLRIVLLTARPMRVQRQTLGWLERMSLRWDLLIMREHGDYDASRDLQATDHGRSSGPYGFDLRLAFEDDRRNVDMFRRRGRALRLHPLRLLRHDRRRVSSGPSSGRARRMPGVGGRSPVQSRRFVNCSGMPKSASLRAAITAWRSSRFLALTRSCSPWVWDCTPLWPSPLMNLFSSRALSDEMPGVERDRLADGGAGRPPRPCRTRPPSATPCA